MYYHQPLHTQLALEESTTGMGYFGQMIFPGGRSDAAAHAFRLQQMFPPTPANVMAQQVARFAPGQQAYARQMMAEASQYEREVPWGSAYQVMGPVAGAGGWKYGPGATGKRPGGGTGDPGPRLPTKEERIQKEQADAQKARLEMIRRQNEANAASRIWNQAQYARQAPVQPFIPAVFSSVPWLRPISHFTRADEED